MNATGNAVLCLRLHPADGGPLGAREYAGVLALLGGITPAVQALPPDAALADVRGALRYFGCDARRLAAVIRVRALALYGVDAAVGVAANPMLARAAAREARPGGTVVLPEDPAAVRAFLADKPVTALDGVGPKAARTLCSYGLDSVGRVAAAPPAALRRILGARLGREVHERALGIDRTPVRPGAAARALAAERLFDRDELDPVRHRRALLSLTEELGAKLRTQEGGQVCRALSLTVRCADRTTLTRTRTLAEPTAHSAALTATAYALYEGLGLQRARVRVLSLRAEELVPAERAARQLSFDPEDEKARRLEAVTDRVRTRFGPHAIARGTLAA
ncbi:DinB/UmuC family translesion DNA polymerase [Streptomyces yangpuensis]|uniref:DinB/UmuC family translesion DNA polymerase n=1 Tax=Streptomyces yangpuensis TaxID=1648182 RepID=UPI0037F3EEA9